MSSGEMVQINTPRLESTLTNPSDCRFTSRQHALAWISPAHSMEVKSFSQGEAEAIFRTQRFFSGVSALSQLLAFVRNPGSTLFEDVFLQGQVQESSDV